MQWRPAEADCVPACALQVGGAEGVVNGMDVEEWAPSKDKFLDVKYDKDTVIEGKAAAKAALQVGGRLGRMCGVYVGLHACG